MTSIVVRTLIIYVLLVFSLRIMGKRQLGELDVGELVSTLLISEIVAIPIDDPDIPMLNAIIPTLFIISIEIIISTLKNKSEKLKNTIEGVPSYIIYKGRLSQKALLENRISINELLAELRTQGVGDISEVEYGIIEQGGQLSIIKKDASPLFHPVIIDGEIIESTLKKLGYNDEWLEKALKSSKLTVSSVLLMTVNDNGDISVIKKDGSF